MYTGQEVLIRLPFLALNINTVFCELPHIGLYIYTPAYVCSVDCYKDYSALTCPGVSISRECPALVFHSPFLYVIGGYKRNTSIGDCERLVYGGKQWEALQSMPQPCSRSSVVECLQSLYVFGGSNSIEKLNSVQRLDLGTLQWHLLQVQLPLPQCHLACFKVDEDRVFLVFKGYLYRFAPSSESIQSVKPILNIPIKSVGGPCYYVRDTVYCSSDSGAALRLKIGSLS